MTLYFAWIILGLTYGQGNQQIASFEKAKTLLLDVYKDHFQTLYSGCAFDHQKKILNEQCAFHSPQPRAQRIEWEHVVPAWALGHHYAQWYKGHKSCRKQDGKPYRGRRCVHKIQRSFRYMEADLYNLVPEIGEVNYLRGKLALGEVQQTRRFITSIDFKLGEQTFQPKADVQGDVARIYLYMDDAYPQLKLLTADSKKMFKQWSEKDPVDAWECERHRRIQAIQKNSNPITFEACQGQVF